MVVTEPGRPTLSLVTTDLSTPVARIVEPHPKRGRTHRTVRALHPKHCDHLVALAGHHPAVECDHRNRAPWYTTKRCPSYLDVIVKLARFLIRDRDGKYPAPFDTILADTGA